MSKQKTDKIDAEQKGIAIINSCITINHFAIARRYIELFYLKYEDVEGFTRLTKHWAKSNIKLI